MQRSIKANIFTWEHLPHQRRLADGSVLAWVPPTRNAQYPSLRGMWVRIISYQVTDERLGELGKVYRLVTTLLNPRVAPALELVALYHERWEIELVIDEIKTHERAQRKVLRSKTPEGVRGSLTLPQASDLRREAAELIEMYRVVQARLGRPTINIGVSGAARVGFAAT